MKKTKRKAYLRNENGVNYRILSRRRGTFENHCDYLVVNEDSGGVYAVRKWIPAQKRWASSTFIGNVDTFPSAHRDKFIDRAKTDFKRRKD